MTKADHVMFRTPNLESSMEFYKHVFGMELGARDNRMDNEVNKYDSAFMTCPETGFQVELVYNPGRDSVSCYVGTVSGGGVGESVNDSNMFGHLAFRTDEIEKVYERAESLGCATNDIIEHPLGDDVMYKIGGIISPEGAPIGLVQKEFV